MNEREREGGRERMERGREVSKHVRFFLLPIAK